jgi:hypothetical protein
VAINAHEVAPGLTYWLAPHPEWEPSENWPEEVLCVCVEAPDGIVLIDPLVPRGAEVEFWEWLDSKLARTDGALRLLLTAPWHARDAALVADRHVASVWARPGARWHGPAPTTTGELPRGIAALLPDGDPDQALFLLRDHETLVPGDVFSGTGGRFHVFIGDQDRQPFLDWLPQLAGLPVERVLIAHGEPVLNDGAARLRDAIAEARALDAEEAS